MSVIFVLLTPMCVINIIETGATLILILKLLLSLFITIVLIIASVKSYRRLKGMPEEEFQIHMAVIGGFELIKFFIAFTFLTPPEPDAMYNYGSALFSYLFLLVSQISMYIVFKKGYLNDSKDKQTDNTTIK
jgi:predicted permease